MHKKSYSAVLFLVFFLLTSCQNEIPSQIQQTFSVPPTLMLAPNIDATPTINQTNTPQYVSTEPYGFYDYGDSFENVPDLSAYGITSTQNSIKINDTDYNSGHQSIEADGTIGASSSSYLSFDFDVKKLLGRNSYDFSDKDIVLSVFIPTGSPINEIWFLVNKGNESVMVTAAKIKDPSDPNDPNGEVTGTRKLPKGKWVEVVIDIRDVSGNISKWGSSWSPQGPLTDAASLDVIRNSEKFSIQGIRATDGNPVSTDFLLDDIRWLDRDSIHINTNADSLRKYAANTHLYVGSFSEYGEVFSVTDTKDAQILAQEFNLLTVVPHGFEFEPSEGKFDFSKSDAMVDFAIGNHMSVFSYMGGVHTQLPLGLKDKSFSELEPILTNFIDTIGQRYKGKIALWNVFSEVVNDAGNGFRNRQTPNTANQQAV